MTLSSHALPSVQAFLRGSQTLFGSHICQFKLFNREVFGCSHLKLVSKAVSPRCLTYMSHQNLSEDGVKSSQNGWHRCLTYKFFVPHELHLNPTSHMFSVSFL